MTHWRSIKPFTEQFWTLHQVADWIMHREPDRVAKLSRQCTDDRDSPIRSEGVPFASRTAFSATVASALDGSGGINAAFAEIEAKLATCELSAHARAPGSGSIHTIAAAEAGALRIGNKGGAFTLEDGQGGVWSDVVFPSDGILTLWPDRTVEEAKAARRMTTSLPPAQLKATYAALVQGWAARGETPNEKERLEQFKKAMGGRRVPRAMLRALEKELPPPKAPRGRPRGHTNPKKLPE